MQYELRSLLHAVIFACMLVFVLSQSPTSSVCPRVLDWRSLLRIIETKSMVMLGKSKFHMGSKPPESIPGDGETPLRLEFITKPFWIDITEVTVQQFEKFVKATNYTTVAEHFGNSFSFWMEQASSLEEIDLKTGNNRHGPRWWINKDNINWRSLSGQHEEHLMNLQLPVNHVSWDDGVAYCKWAGGRLPTEIEWEFACRGGLEKVAYPWGAKLKSNGSHMTNIWQGTFPVKNTKKDGFVLRAPVASFPCNAYGLYDVSGNVWEWVDGQWSKKSSNGYYSANVRVQKGGSYLCHRKHCFRYRCAARTKASRDSTSSNVGFRCAYDITS